MPCVPIGRIVARVFALLACFGLALVVLTTNVLAVAAESGGAAADYDGESGPESEDDDDATEMPHAVCSGSVALVFALRTSVVTIDPRRRSIANGLGRGPPQRG